MLKVSHIVILLNTMENKISYFAGFILTTIWSMTLYDLAMAAGVGLIGGFFGILGKELYYWIKNSWK